MALEEMKKVFEGEIFSVWQWDQKLFDGSIKVFEKITRTDAVRIIGVMPDKTIVFVWDDQPNRSPVFSLPGGQVDANEYPEKAAQREFLEETGYEAKKINPLFSYEPAGRVEYTIHFFIAQNLEKISEPQHNAEERMSLQFLSFEEFLALGQDENLRDMRLRIMLLEAQLDPQKRKELEEKLYG